MATCMLAAVAQRREALPAEGATSTPITEVPEPGDLVWAEEDGEDVQLFERFAVGDRR